MGLKMPKGVLFDLDGTLLDSAPDFIVSLNNLLSKHNQPKLDGHKVSVNLLKKGIYAKVTHHSTVRIAPALTIQAWQIDQIADGIRNVIKDL